MKLLKSVKDKVCKFVKFIYSSYKFKKECKTLLQNTNVSNEEIDQLLNKYNIKHKNDLMSNKNAEDYRDIFFNELYLKILRVRSFYNNHNVFKNLYGKTTKNKILYDFKIIVNNKTFNQKVNVFNLKELKKNIEFLNLPEFNLLVLETALRLSNVEMYNLVEGVLDFQQDKTKILEIMCFVISNYGYNIKDKPLSDKIRQYIHKNNFYQYNHKSYLYDSFESFSLPFYPHNLFDKKILHLNSFLDIDIADTIIKQNLNDEQIKNLHLTEQQTKNILKKIDKEKVNIELINFYLCVYSYEQPIIKRIKFIIKNNLMNEQVYELIYDNSLIRNQIFDEYQNLKNIMPEEKLKIAITKHKENLSRFSLNLTNYSDFFKNYPYELSRTELKNFLVNSEDFYCYRNDLEDTSIQIINEKYLGQLKAPMYFLTDNKEGLAKLLEKTKEMLNILYEKYPQYMNNQDFFLEVITQSKNDLFLYFYLNKYFEQNNNEVLKLRILNQLQPFHNISLFRNTLKWVIENNLLKELVSHEIKNNQMFIEQSNNYLVPVLIEKYNVSSDIFIEKSVNNNIINKDLFYFVLNNYQLSQKTKQYVCEKIYQHNSLELAEELFKRNICPTNSFMDIIEEKPNEAGNVFIKCYLKNKLEDKFENKIKSKVIKI